MPTLLHGAYDVPLLAANVLPEPDSAAAAPVLALLVLVPVVLCVELVWTLLTFRAHWHGRVAPVPLQR